MRFIGKARNLEMRKGVRNEWWINELKKIWKGRRSRKMGTKWSKWIYTEPTCVVCPQPACLPLDNFPHVHIPYNRLIGPASRWHFLVRTCSTPCSRLSTSTGSCLVLILSDSLTLFPSRLVQLLSCATRLFRLVLRLCVAFILTEIQPRLKITRLESEQRKILQCQNCRWQQDLKFYILYNNAILLYRQ